MRKNSEDKIFSDFTIKKDKQKTVYPFLFESGD